MTAELVGKLLLGNANSAYENGVYFDVGANIGGYIETYQHLAPSSVIHAFEPHPESFQEMVRRCSDKTRFRTRLVLNNLGVDIKPGEGTFKIVNAWSLQPCLDGFKVRFTTLDKYVEENGIDRLDYVKIDVDGYETRVLLGGELTLARFRPSMMIEMSMMIDWYGYGGYKACVNWLFDHRYRVFRVYGDEYTRESLMSDPLGKNSSFDVLCVPEEKFDYYLQKAK